MPCVRWCGRKSRQAIRRLAAASLKLTLSRLGARVLAADQAGLDYGLRLDSQEIRPGSGEMQRRRCLEAPALHGSTD